MKIIKFEDLIAWQKAKFLAIHIYKCFETTRDYSFKDQICEQPFLSLIILQKDLKEIQIMILFDF